MNNLDSALIIPLSGSIDWSAALPPLNAFTGTLTAINPGNAFDPTLYARRQRELQHRDMVASAAIAKVSIFAQTVWNGTMVAPILPGVTGVTDYTGTNVFMPLDPTQVGTVLPNGNTAVTYVLNADIPYTSVTKTEVNLYNRDLLIYETLARAATIFQVPPINRIDPTGLYIGSTSVWATAQGTNTPAVISSADAMNQAAFLNPDVYLAQRDNQNAAYVAQVAQALQNPFKFATRIYVQINSATSINSEESEVYVLTDNQFVSGNTYTAGTQVIYMGTWYQALATTTDTPPSSNWTTLAGPTLRQFLADPSLDSRNRIVYDTVGNTLQWFRETLDLIHIPQIVGFYVPGIFPGQTIQTVAAVPEKKDARFYLQKAARIQFSSGTWASQQVINPTGNRTAGASYVTGGINAIWQQSNDVALTAPDQFTLNLQNLICTSGTYALNCLVRPSTEIDINGGENQQGVISSSDGGTTYTKIGDIRNWSLALPAGGWQLVIDFANVSSTLTSSFGIQASQGAIQILANTLPIYYTDSNGNPLPEGTIISAPGINIQSAGQVYNFSIQWTAGAGQLHIVRLRFIQVNSPSTSHYNMQASWLGAVGGSNAVSNLNVFGQPNMPDVMPFAFWVGNTQANPQITVSWIPQTSAAWQSISYSLGDQVVYNLIYWEANTATAPTDIPGQSSVWTQVGIEPQVPLIFEQIELTKFVQATATPNLTGFQGFHQDMSDRALHATRDSYYQALNQTGTNPPQFVDGNSSWTFASTGSWMSFIEVYAPRLRQQYNVAGSNIATGKQYEVIAQAGGAGTYNGQVYVNGQRFYGVAGQTVMYPITGTVFLNQVGAYRLSSPADLGKTALVPDGLQYMQAAGTGTVMGWYDPPATIPTHQVLQPWMIEQGFYVAMDDFQSPTGNAMPANPAPDNTFHPNGRTGGNPSQA
jgi:hypothetical protein